MTLGFHGRGVPYGPMSALCTPHRPYEYSLALSETSSGNGQLVRLSPRVDVVNDRQEIVIALALIELL